MAGKENQKRFANTNADDEDFRSPKKYKRSQKKSSSERFGSKTSEAEISEVTKGYTPANTKRSTNWAVTVFNDWRASRELQGSESCSSDLLQNPIVDKLNKWLSMFINEVRWQDGGHYPPRSIHQLLAGLQRHMLEENFTAPKFLDRSISEIQPIHDACDTVYHKLHSSGIGTTVHHTAIITEEEEEKLWSFWL